MIAMCRDVFPDTPYARAYGIAADERLRTAAFATPAARTWQWWSGNVSTTRDDFHRVGAYDESFRAYGWEDVEWGYRLHRAGREILIAPGFSTLHHGPVTTTENFERAFTLRGCVAKFIDERGIWHRRRRSLSLSNSLVAAAAAGRRRRACGAHGGSATSCMARLPARHRRQSRSPWASTSSRRSSNARAGALSPLAGRAGAVLRTVREDLLASSPAFLPPDTNR